MKHFIEMNEEEYENFKRFSVAKKGDDRTVAELQKWMKMLVDAIWEAMGRDRKEINPIKYEKLRQLAQEAEFKFL